MRHSPHTTRLSDGTTHGPGISSRTAVFFFEMVGRPNLSRKLIGLSLGDHRAEGQHQLPLVLARHDVKKKSIRPTRALSALSLSARYRSPFFLARSKRLALLSASEAIASNSLGRVLINPPCRLYRQKRTSP